MRLLLSSLHLCQRNAIDDMALTDMLCLQLWPLASLVNYRFVPVKLRVLFVNCVAFLWYVLCALLVCCTLLGSRDTTADFWDV